MTDSGNTTSEQLLMMHYGAANQLRMAARRALEWIEMVERTRPQIYEHAVHVSAVSYVWLFIATCIH